MKIAKVHIGEIIENKVNEKKIKFSEFSKMLGIKRQNVHKTVFDKSSLDTDFLAKICSALDFNFFAFYAVIDNGCNKNDYFLPREAKVTISVEMGETKKDTTARIIFGENEVNIL
jgi:DNA-binding Xre family transcriptional regulator